MSVLDVPATDARRSRVAARPPSTDRLASVVVWSVLAVMTLTVLWHIARYGHNVPLAEDWNMVPPLTGNEPSFWGWVWSQNNEHRLPVARLLYLAALTVTRDFRSGMVVDTLLVAALAGGLILAARRVRGRTSVVDAFFPVVMLHLGHWENLLWGWQMQFVLVLVAIGVLLAMLVRAQTPVAPRTALLLGATVALLPLGGGSALPMVPAALVGLAALAWLPRATKRSRRIALGAAAGAVLVTGLYFVGWQPATWYPDNPGIVPTARTTVAVLALAWGPASESLLTVAALVTAAFLGSAVVVLVRAVRHGGDQRGRALALLCLLGGTGLTALAVAYGRAALVPSEGLPDRYVMVTLPALLVAWFAWELFGPARARRVVHALVLGFVVVLVPLNTAQGYGWRDWQTAGMEQVEADLRAGVPLQAMVERHDDFLMHWDDEALADRMAMLQRAGIGPFAQLRTEADG